MANNINPRTWNADVVESTKRRGRKPGQLKGTKYNVPKRKAVSIYVSEPVVNEMFKLCDENLINRSQLITKAIQNWIMRGSTRPLINYESASWNSHNSKSIGSESPKKCISVNLPEVAFQKVDEKSLEWGRSRSELLVSIVEDGIARGLSLSHEEAIA